MVDLSDRLSNIEKLERELLSRSRISTRRGAPFGFVTLFAFGAIKRTLAQSRGFRTMILESNFPSAAILLRTQIDTAMRVNGLKHLDNPEIQLRDVLHGQKTFRDLISIHKTTKQKPIKMQDAFLLEKIVEEEPWIKEVYKQTSDFVHLSFRPLFASIASTDDTDGSITFAISGEDIAKSEADYYEVCDAFHATSKLSGNILVKLLSSENYRI